jgi:hypothetical protein
VTRQRRSGGTKTLERAAWASFGTPLSPLEIARSWASLVHGYATHAGSERPLALFHRWVMTRLDGFVDPATPMLYSLDVFAREVCSGAGPQLKGSKLL